MSHLGGVRLALSFAAASGLLAQPTPPVRLTLDRVVITPRVVQGTDPVAVAARWATQQTITGNRFTVLGTYTGTRGTGRFSISLGPEASEYTSIGLTVDGGSARLTPAPVFAGNASYSATGSPVAMSVVLADGSSPVSGDCRLSSVVGNRDFRCSPTFMPLGRPVVSNSVLFSTIVDLGDRLDIKAYYTYADRPPADTLEIVSGSLRPAPPRLPAGDRVTFAARAKYEFTSFAAGQLALRLFDKPTDGVLLASSDFVNATRPSGENDLEIRDFPVSDSTPSTVYLQAVMINRANETVALRTIPVAYERPPRISVLPTSYQLSGAALGKTQALTESLDVLNSGGGALDWRFSSALVNLAPTGDAVGTARVRLTPAQGTGLGSGRSTRVTLEIDTEQVTRGGVFRGQFAVESTGIQSVTVPVEVTVVEPAGEDRVTLSNVLPAAGVLRAGTSQRFTAVARYNLASAQAGTVMLELYDRTTLLRQSAPASIQAGAGEASLTIPEFVPPPGASQLSLKAVLSAGTKTVESSPITYTLRADTLEISTKATWLWTNTQTILLGDVIYTSQSPAAKIRVTAVNAAGNVLAEQVLTGPRLPGFFQLPSFVTPSDAFLQLTATAIDEQSGAIVATSPPKTIRLDPPPSIEIRFGLGLLSGSLQFFELDDLQLAGPRLGSSWGPPSRVGEPAARVRLDPAPSGAYWPTLDIVGIGENGRRSVLTSFTPIPASKEIFAIPGDVPVSGFVALEFVPVIANDAQLLQAGERRVDVANVSARSAMSNVLQTGAPPQVFRHTVRYRTAGQARLWRRIQIEPPPPGTDRGVLEAPVDAALPDTAFVDETSWVALSRDTRKVTVTYSLRNERGEIQASSVPIEYGNFRYPPVTLRPGAPSPVEIGRGLLSNLTGAFRERIVEPAGKGIALDFLRGAGNPLIKAPQRQAQSQLAPPDSIGIGRIWEFSPAIPADGTFAAGLTLEYDPSDFPDHPGFDEAKLGIVAFEPATGQISFLPTVLDRAKRTATARLDRLASVYTLAVPGPFDTAVLSSAVSRSSYPNQTVVIANTAAVAGRASFADTAETVTIPAQGQAFSVLTPLSGDRGGQTTASAQSAGTVLLGAPGLEAIEMTKSTARFALLPEVIRDSRFATEIHLANTSNFAADATIGLWNADGSAVASATHRLEPRSRLAQPAPALFPEMPEEFSGYVTLDLDAGVTAASLQTRRSVAGALTAMQIPDPARTATSLYSPFVSLGAGAPVTILNLVNPTALDAVATVNVFGNSGAPLAPPVQVRLAAGRQERRTLGEILGVQLAAGVTGALRIDSTIRGLAGAVVIQDRQPVQDFQTLIPLDLTPARSWIIPFVSNESGFATLLALQNGSAVAANVQIRVFAAGGQQIGSAAIPLPANGSRHETLSTLVAAAAARQGSLTIIADQPVIPLAIAAAPPESSTDIAAIVPQPLGAAPGPGGSGEPGPAAVDFGSVAVGQTRDAVVTYRNTGATALTVRTITSSNPRFTVVSPQAPFPVAAGASREIGVRFAPVAAGPQSGTLTIATDVQALAAVAVALTGTGVGAPPVGGPRIEAAPTAIAFDGIAPGGQTTRLLTLRNTGSSALTVSALTVTSPQFQVTGLTAPLTIAAQGAVSLTLRFSAAAAGAFAGELTIASNDPSTPTLRIPLTGVAAGPVTAPRLRLSEAEIDFGEVRVGQNTDQTVVITNTGNAPLEVSSIQSDSARFTLPGSGSFTLAPGNAFDMRIVFTPTSVGSHSGAILIRSNDSASPARITVSGTGR